MARRSGSADLPLHGGRVPPWLAQRMARLGPIDVYDHTLGVLRQAVEAARLGNDEKLQAVRRLDTQARRLEQGTRQPGFEAYLAGERQRSPGYGGRTVFGPAIGGQVAASRPPAQMTADVCVA